MRPRLAAWLAVVVLAGATGAEAQSWRGQGSGSAYERRSAVAHERRERIKKRIRAMRAYTLTEELSLDEATSARLFPALARYDDEIDKLLEKRIDIQRRLVRVEAMRDRGAIDRLIDEAVANQRGFWDLEDRRLAALRKILTPAQTARLLVVLPTLERKIQNQLRRASVSTSGTGDRNAGAAPDGDDGDDRDGDDDQLPDEDRPPRRKQPRRREAPLAPGRRPHDAPGDARCDPNAGPCR